LIINEFHKISKQNLLSPFPSLIEWVCGGHYVYNPTLKRFFLFHFLFPFLLCGFTFLHLFYLLDLASQRIDFLKTRPLLFKRHKVVRFLISPNQKKVKIEVNKIMNPAFLLGTAFNIAYWHRKYHSGTICKGVSNPQTSKALSGCETAGFQRRREKTMPACYIFYHR